MCEEVQMAAEWLSCMRYLWHLICCGSVRVSVGEVYVFAALPPLLAPLDYGCVYEDLNSYVRD